MPATSCRVRDSRTYDDLGCRSCRGRAVRSGDPMVIDGTTWEMVDIVSARADSVVVAIIALESLVNQ